MNSLVSLQVGQVSTGVLAQMALVGLLACVHSVVSFEVVEVCGGVVTLRALVWLLTTVRLHVAGQVVWVVREEGTGRACVHLVTALSWTVRRPSGVFRQHIQGALGTYLSRGAILVL